MPPSPSEYAALVKRLTADLNVDMIFEPGRMIAGNSGVLLSEVLYVKRGEDRDFLIIDAAMNDLIRPALYEAYHDICLLYTAPSPRDQRGSRMPSSA